MITQEFQSRITVKCYCEICRVGYMTETSEAGCPICENKKQQEQERQQALKKTKKEKGKNDR